MVMEEKFEEKNSFRCEECSFHYRDRITAENCEEHCRRHAACSEEITRKSLERSG